MKKIVVDFDKCTGCKTCELVCSLHHYGKINPQRSRIRVIRDYDRGMFFPIIAGPVTDKECIAKTPAIIKGERYDACILCRASCPSRSFFTEPDTGERFSCDLCAKCITFCGSGALTLSSA